MIVLCSQCVALFVQTELMRMKTNESPSEAAGSYSTSWNARRSYNLLRMSLSRPLTLPHCDTDTDEEMEIDEDGETNAKGSRRIATFRKNHRLGCLPETLNPLHSSKLRTIYGL